MAWDKLAPPKQGYAAEDVAVADRVCEACASWDGSPEALKHLRFGWDWQRTMAVITPAEPCWADVMRVCGAIVESEGHFMATSGHIYPQQMIRWYGGIVSGDTLTWPATSDDRARRGDPWDAPASWRSGR